MGKVKDGEKREGLRVGNGAQGKGLTVANATKIFIGRPILRVVIAQLATYKFIGTLFEMTKS